jgi:hypothetical protein
MIDPLSDSLNRPPAVKKKAESNNAGGSSGISASGSGSSAASGCSGGSGSAGGGQGKSDVLLKMEGGPSGVSANTSQALRCLNWSSLVVVVPPPLEVLG